MSPNIISWSKDWIRKFFGVKRHLWPEKIWVQKNLGPIFFYQTNFGSKNVWVLKIVLGQQKKRPGHVRITSNTCNIPPLRHFHFDFWKELIVSTSCEGRVPIRTLCKTNIRLWSIVSFLSPHCFRKQENPLQLLIGKQTLLWGGNYYDGSLHKQ